MSDQQRARVLFGRVIVALLVLQWTRLVLAPKTSMHSSSSSTSSSSS